VARTSGPLSPYTLRKYGAPGGHRVYQPMSELLNPTSTIGAMALSFDR
jgi:hypothetical protein